MLCAAGEPAERGGGGGAIGAAAAGESADEDVRRADAQGGGARVREGAKGAGRLDEAGPILIRFNPI